ncbi:hypothetical protein H4R18_005630 [Coemansia javaensis]|uniref:Uncharacterized protein n=1 Tax=Coemansia javaensis TaxID=2761396 RepID=A0A9W8LD04_9FUNG|nr:hypothetical protein H4R18_005630 [Coemansia javaensis]
MAEAYTDLALRLAFPALVAAIVLYYAATAAAGALAARRRRQRQQAEASLRRKLYADRYAAAAAAGPPQPQNQNQNQTEEPRPVLRPQAPASSSRPFGSDFMTMSDLRSRITGPSGSCVRGSCCG